MNTLFVENSTEKWQDYSEFCRSKKWCAGWAINYNAGTNGLGYRNYDYVIIGEQLGESETPWQFVKFIIENKIKIGIVIIYIKDPDISNLIVDELNKHGYNVKYHLDDWNKTFCEYTQAVNEV